MRLDKKYVDPRPYRFLLCFAVVHFALLGWPREERVECPLFGHGVSRVVNDFEYEQDARRKTQDEHSRQCQYYFLFYNRAVTSPSWRRRSSSVNTQKGSGLITARYPQTAINSSRVTIMILRVFHPYHWNSIQRRLFSQRIISK